MHGNLVARLDETCFIGVTFISRAWIWESKTIALIHECFVIPIKFDLSSSWSVQIKVQKTNELKLTWSNNTPPPLKQIMLFKLKSTLETNFKVQVRTTISLIFFTPSLSNLKQIKRKLQRLDSDLVLLLELVACLDWRTSANYLIYEKTTQQAVLGMSCQFFSWIQVLIEGIQATTSDFPSWHYRNLTSNRCHCSWSKTALEQTAK